METVKQINDYILGRRDALNLQISKLDAIYYEDKQKQNLTKFDRELLVSDLRMYHIQANILNELLDTINN